MPGKPFLPNSSSIDSAIDHSVPVDGQKGLGASQKKMFRSIWLCCQQLSRSLLPVMQAVAKNEAMCNGKSVTPFLPHVTLCSGENLSPLDCELIVSLFKQVFPNGIRVKASEFKGSCSKNPPIQLVFKLDENENKVVFKDFPRLVKERLNLDIQANTEWLHTSLAYKTTEHERSFLSSSVEIAANSVRSMIDQTVLLDEYAVTTGKAWVAQDVALWARVKPKKLIVKESEKIQNIQLQPSKKMKRDEGCLQKIDADVIEKTGYDSPTTLKRDELSSLSTKKYSTPQLKSKTKALVDQTPDLLTQTPIEMKHKKRDYTALVTPREIFTDDISESESSSADIAIAALDQIAQQLAVNSNHTELQGQLVEVKRFIIDSPHGLSPAGEDAVRSFLLACDDLSFEKFPKIYDALFDFRRQLSSLLL